MTQMIVALDVDDPMLWHSVFHACRRAGVTFFKINLRSFFVMADPLAFMRANKCDVFLDLKLYDTRDTVHAVADSAFDLGARFLTVHATPSMLNAAMRARPPGDYHKVLAVEHLTDTGKVLTQLLPFDADGIVCSVASALHVRPATQKIIVCPGIRPLTTSSAIVGAHVSPATPSEARAAGADFIVVGRPIVDAQDPAAAARAIMEEIT